MSTPGIRLGFFTRLLTLVVALVLLKLFVILLPEIAIVAYFISTRLSFFVFGPLIDRIGGIAYWVLLFWCLGWLTVRLVCGRNSKLTQRYVAGSSKLFTRFLSGVFGTLKVLVRWIFDSEKRR